MDSKDNNGLEATSKNDLGCDTTRNASRRLSLLLFLGLFVTFAYFFHRESGWNADSRIRLTYAIVEQHSFTIDEYVKSEAPDVGDKAFYNGHYYSDKIIGTSLLGVVPMTILHIVSRTFNHQFSEYTKRYIVTTFSVGILGALAAVILCRLLLLFGTGAGGSIFLTLAFVFGTQVFSICTVFLSYAPALCFEMLSYLILVKFRDLLAGRRLFLAGLAIGASLLCEYTVGILAIGLSIYAFAHAREKRATVFFCLGVIIPLLPFVVYTMICFGRPIIPYEYLARDEFKEGMSRGFQGIIGFNPAVLYFITVHHYRGLFFHSPFLALAVWGLIIMWRDGKRRSDPLLCIWVVVAYLAINSSYYMWWGGWTNGPRHLIPALPFLVIPLGWVWRSRKAARIALFFLVPVGFFFNTIPALVDAQLPQALQAKFLYNPRFSYGEFYPDVLWESGVKVFWQSRLATNPDRLARNAGHLLTLRRWWSLLPLAIFWIVAGWALGRTGLKRPKARLPADLPSSRDV